MTLFRTLAAATLLSCFFTIGLAATASADPCDDLAKQLADHITGLKVGKTVANVIYLQHASAKQVWLGCSGHNVTNEISASSLGKKPTQDFQELVASMGAVVFTIPKNDALKGVQRCTRRIGLIRGYNIDTRYRKLDVRCARTKEITQITISREREK